jgi:hypothetical protein
MGKFVMILQSAAKPGRGDEYSKWCRTQHFPDIMRIPGVEAARRYALNPGVPGEQARFISIFDLDCDDPQDVFNEMKRRNSTGEMRPGDSYDPASLVFSFGSMELELG